MGEPLCISGRLFMRGTITCIIRLGSRVVHRSPARYNYKNIMQKVGKKGCRLFFVLEVDDAIGFLVIGLDHDRIGEPVEHPELGIRHGKPPDKTVNG